MSDDDLTIIGRKISGYAGLDAGPFGIRRADRRRHLYGGNTRSGHGFALSGRPPA